MVTSSSLLLILLIYNSGTSGANEKESTPDVFRYVITGLGYIALALYYCHLNSSIVNDFFQQLMLNLRTKNDLNLILNNLEESIIIINNNKIEFVNDVFLNQF